MANVTAAPEEEMERHPFVVLDLNVMRHAADLAPALAACQRDGSHLLLPDGAFFEMSKGRDQFGQWYSSLREVAKYREVVRVSSKLTDIMREERDKKACCASLVADAFVAPVQRMLEEIDNGTCTTVRGLIDGPLKKLLPAAMETWSDDETHKQEILRCRDIFIETLGTQRIKELRRSPDRFREWFASQQASGILFQGLKNLWHLDDATAVRFLTGPSVSVAFIAAHIGLAVRWGVVGGLEPLPAQQSTNDLHDIEYIALGAISSLHTQDKRTQAVYEAVRAGFDWRSEHLSRSLGPD